MSPEPTMDKVLSALSFETVEMLRRFRAGKSFKEVGKQIGRDERTVSKSLLALDEAFADDHNVHLLERVQGQKSYRLTPEGEDFVDALEPVAAATLTAIESVSTSARIPIPCTSNCLGYFHQLREALPTARKFDIVPLPRRTAELDRVEQRLDQPNADLYPLALFSVHLTTAQKPELHKVTSPEVDVQLFTLDINDYSLLANENLGLRNPVSVPEVLDSGVTLLVPKGGAVWQFLAREYPDWHILRPFQHVPVPHLDYGLKCLAKKLVTRSAMVVHGLTLGSPGMPRLEDAKAYQFQEMTDRHHIAVTGLFRDERALGRLGPDRRKPFDEIWDIAQDALGPREGTLAL